MSKLPTTAVVIEPLGILDKISLAWRIPLLAFRCTARFASLCLLRGKAAELHWRQKLALAFLQASRVTLTSTQQAQQRKYLTGPRIQEYCGKHGLKHRAISVHGATLPNERKVPEPVLHFVTAPVSQSGGTTVFYSHGGGYHNPIKAEAHVPFALQCAAACKAQQVVFLEYSLSPEQPYPCQLVQAVAGLQYLLKEEAIPAESIILGGDSAGGHLTASLLTHIVQPSPYAPPIDLHGCQFKAVLLVSPWMAMSEEQIRVLPPMHDDFLTKESIVRFWDMFKPGLDEVWSNRCGTQDAVAVWRQLFPGGHEHAICRRAMLAVGTLEVLYESCVSFGLDIGFECAYVNGTAGLRSVQETDFVLAVALGEAHVQPALDCAVGYYDGLMMKSILRFFTILLGNKEKGYVGIFAARKRLYASSPRDQNSDDVIGRSSRYQPYCRVSDYQE